MKTPADASMEDEMLPEYDFTEGIRGKHHKAYRAGHRVKVHHSDGTTEQQQVAPQPGIVELAPDVQKYFPDSESVNRALRGLVRLIPGQSERE